MKMAVRVTDRSRRSLLSIIAGGCEETEREMEGRDRSETREKDWRREIVARERHGREQEDGESNQRSLKRQKRQI